MVDLRRDKQGKVIAYNDLPWQEQQGGHSEHAKAYMQAYSQSLAQQPGETKPEPQVILDNPANALQAALDTGTSPKPATNVFIPAKPPDAPQ